MYYICNTSLYLEDLWFYKNIYFSRFLHFQYVLMHLSLYVMFLLKAHMLIDSYFQYERKYPRGLAI